MLCVCGAEAARAFHCPLPGEVSGQGTGAEPGSFPMDTLWTTCPSAGDGGFDYWQVSTTLRGCPQVIHRFIHRMAAVCGLLKVIHNPQLRGCVVCSSSASGARERAASASYPQAEVIHRPHLPWKTRTRWWRRPQVGGEPWPVVSATGPGGRGGGSTSAGDGSTEPI